MLYPSTISGYYGSDTDDSSKDVVIEDVPGTGCTALLLASTLPGNRFALVQVMTPAGRSFGLSSQTIPLAQLRSWAYAATVWLDAHPA